MHGMTLANLQSAYGGESMAHMRYMVWAEKARKDGFANVARLFTAISLAEQVHASNHFNVMKDAFGPASVTAGAGFGLGTTSQNLQNAIDGELHEVHEMYPAFAAVSKLQEEKQASVSFHYAVSAEKVHAEMYAKAKAAVDAGRDVTLSTVWVCKVCGHTHEGPGAPDKCPICARGAGEFVAFA